jgi:hypothetical protein
MLARGGDVAAFALCRWLFFFNRPFEGQFAAIVALGALWAALQTSVLQDFMLARVSLAAGHAGPRPGQGILKALGALWELAATVASLAFVPWTWLSLLRPRGASSRSSPGTRTYCAWIFHAGRWTGYPGDRGCRAGVQRRRVDDAFGNDILFTMFSSPRGAPACLAAPGFAALLLAWNGAGPFVLARLLSGLPRRPCPLFALWVAGGVVLQVPGLLRRFRAAGRGRRTHRPHARCPARGSRRQRGAGRGAEAS